MFQSTQQSPSQHPIKFTFLIKVDKNINMNSQDQSPQLASNGILLALYWRSDGTMVFFLFNSIGRITIWN